MDNEQNTKIDEILFEQAIKLYEQRDFIEAEKKFKEALEIIPDSEDIMYNLALTYVELKKYDLAKNIVKNIKEIDCKEIYDELNKINGSFKEQENTNSDEEPLQESELNVTYLTKKELDEYKLKENEGSYCPKCKVTHFAKTGKCIQCGGNTLSTKWYSRFCKERLAFIFTLPIFIAIAFQMLSEDKPNIFLVYFISVFALFSLYTTASIFLGMGGFTEKFPANNLPIRAFEKFSFSRYFSEFIRIILIFLALFIFFGIVKLLQGDY